MKAEVFNKPAIPVAYALLILDVAASYGVAQEQLLAQARLSPAALGQADGRLSMFECGLLLHKAMQLTGQRGFGYDIGLHSNLTSHGFLGYGVLSQTTLRQAIDFGTSFLQLRLANLGAVLRREGDFGVLEISETVPMGPVRQCMFDLFLVGLARMAVQLFGGGAEMRNAAVEMHFDYPQPDYFAAYRERLPPARFNQPANALYFPARYLDARLNTANPVTAQLVNQQCEQEQKLLGLSGNIMERVRAAMIIGKDGYPSQVEVAASLSMSTRSLKRRLQQLGSGYLQLLTQARQRDSRQLLKDPSISVARVAARVGYRNPANFTRAFRAWTGQTPSQYQRQLQDKR